ncbi:hypothetical protein ACFLYP_02650 [Chloroflexota bacterium]
MCGAATHLRGEAPIPPQVGLLVGAQVGVARPAHLFVVGRQAQIEEERHVPGHPALGHPHQAIGDIVGVGADAIPQQVAVGVPGVGLAVDVRQAVTSLLMNYYSFPNGIH